jgi:hypothetical protein
MSFVYGNLHNSFPAVADCVNSLLKNMHWPVLVFCAMLWSVGGSLLATVCSIACFTSSSFHELLEWILSLWNSYTEKLGGMRSEDEGSQRPCLTKRTPKSPCSKAALCSQCGQSPHSVSCASLLKDFHGNWASVSPMLQSTSSIKTTWCHAQPITDTSCVSKFCYPSEHCHFIQYFLLLHEQQQIISKQCNIQEWTYFLLMNKTGSHMQSFYAACDSSSTATWVTSTWVLWGKMGESITQEEQLLN